MRALVLAALIALPLPAVAQGPFGAEIASLMERSPTFAAEVEPILPRLIVNTAETLRDDLLVILVPGGDLAVLYFDEAKLAEIDPTPEELDIILVHEFFGHAVPQLRDGVVCHDPVRGQRYLSSCVGKREAIVLRELGLQPRTRYGLR